MKTVFIISEMNDEEEGIKVVHFGKEYETYQEAEKELLEYAPSGKYQIEKIFVKN